VRDKLSNDVNNDEKFGIAMLEHLPVVEAPEEIWVSIEQELLSAPSSHGSLSRRGSLRPTRSWRWAFATAAMVLILVGIAYWNRTRWIETGSASRAEIKIGDIGTVEIEPNTRVRVVTEKPGEHRLRLAHGEIQATISAPPRLFFVDTASGTAIDLGCEYRLSTDEDGSGLLRVTKGWVSFQWHGLESLVPAGASCKTRPKIGPDVPYFDDATERLKQATESGDLNVMLREARARDTLTLWHMLWRVPESDRAKVYDRIATLTKLPVSISRESALKLDRETLSKLKEELAWTW
jgi:FecR protein